MSRRRRETTGTSAQSISDADARVELGEELAPLALLVRAEQRVEQVANSERVRAQQRRVVESPARCLESLPYAR